MLKPFRVNATPAMQWRAKSWMWQTGVFVFDDAANVEATLGALQDQQRNPGGRWPRFGGVNATYDPVFEGIL
jgi:hypothetical protein